MSEEGFAGEIAGALVEKHVIAKGKLLLPGTVVAGGGFGDVEFGGDGFFEPGDRERLLADGALHRRGIFTMICFHNTDKRRFLQ